jgi:hypothetical protein
LGGVREIRDGNQDINVAGRTRIDEMIHDARNWAVFAKGMVFTTDCLFLR